SWPERACMKRFGVVPPERASNAWPRSVRARSRSVATAPARAPATLSSLSWMCHCMGFASTSVVVVPGASVAFDQGYRGAGTPGAGGVAARGLVAAGPGVQDGVDPVPGGLDFVPAHEQGRVAAHHVQDQAFVGVRL